jgi:hypothetical protein
MTTVSDPSALVNAATLSLTLDLEAIEFAQVRGDFGEGYDRLAGPASPMNIAELLGVLETLWALSALAVSQNEPVADLAFRLARLPTPPPDAEVQGRDAWWAAQRTWGREARSQGVWEGEIPAWGSSLTGPEHLEVLQVQFGSPFGVLISLGEKVLTAPILLFVKTVEYTWNTPKRIRVESTKLDAAQMRAKTEILEQELNQRQIQAEIDKHKHASSEAIIDGVLTVDDDGARDGDPTPV